MTPAGQRWSNDRPKEPGWYWRRYEAFGSVVIAVVHVAKSGGYLCIDNFGGIVDESCLGEWQGPIAPHDQEAG